MQKLKFQHFFYILTISVAVIMSSCIKDVDFDQADDLTLTPVITSSIVYAEVEASRFSENGMELETVTDSLANIEIFENDFIIDNLVRAELVFEATNSINRTFGLQIDFLNAVDELEHTLSFDASPSPTGNTIVTTYTEVFEDMSLDALKMKTKMAVTLRLYPSNDGSSLDENALGNIILKSKGLFYFSVSP
jgi:hypothetical protein